MKAKRLLSYKEASVYIGLSVSQLKRLVRKGILPSVVIGKRRLFDIHDLDEFIEQKKKRGISAGWEN